MKCSDIWDYISRDKHAWVFSEPVNAERLGIPDYHSIILEPMDLSTVKAKLKSGEIVSPEEFERNMKLIFQNAMCYHPPGHDVHTMAQHLLNTLEAKCDAMQSPVEGSLMMKTAGLCLRRNCVVNTSERLLALSQFALI